MSDAVDRLARGLLQVRRALPRLERSYLSSLDPLTVSGGDEDVQLDTLGWYRPRVGDPVWVLAAGERAVILGPTSPNETTRPPLQGTVAAVSGATVTVTAGDSSWTLPFVASYAPRVGDTVLLLWQESTPGAYDGVVLGKVGIYTPPPPVKPPTTAQPVPDKPTAPARPRIANPITITPTAAATWRGSGWRTDTRTLYQGDWTGRGDNSTWFFYGGLFDQLQIPGITVTKAEMYLHAAAGGASGATTAKACLHSGRTKAAAKPAAGETFDGPSLADNAAGWAEIPAAIGQALATGSRDGVGLIGTGRSAYSGYLPLGSSGGDPLQGSIRITWTI